MKGKESPQHLARLGTGRGFDPFPQHPPRDFSAEPRRADGGLGVSDHRDGSTVQGCSLAPPLGEVEREVLPSGHRWVLGARGGLAWNFRPGAFGGEALIYRAENALL